MKTKIIKTGLSALSIGLITLSFALPALTLAKGKPSSSSKLTEGTTTIGCPTGAFGHLIAPGWLAKHPATFTTQSLVNCFLPPGIAKKLGLSTTTPTPPVVTAPVISDIHTTIGTTTATVFWTTDIPSDSLVFLSTVNPVSTTTSTSFGVGALVTNHSVSINNLNASTTYFAIVRSTDAQAHSSYSNQFSFITLGPTVPNLTLTNSVVTVGTSTATLTWTTNLPATSVVFFGTTTPLSLSASSTQSVSTSTLVTGHTITLTNLATSTHYQAVMESVSGSQTALTTPIGFTTGL